MNSKTTPKKSSANTKTAPKNKTKTKTKKRKITISTKIEIVEFLKTPGSSIRKAVDKFNVSKGTVQRAKRQASDLLMLKENNWNTSLTRLSPNELNSLVFRWFSLARVQGFPISGPILQEKARQLAKKLGNESFNASDGWLTSWKRKYNVSFRVSGNPEKVHFSDTEDIVEYVFQEHEAVRNHKIRNQKEKEKELLDDEGQTGLSESGVKVSDSEAQFSLRMLEIYFKEQDMVAEAGDIAKMMKALRSKRSV
eukprot:CAMPEP_0116059018 /NCGR_PEP_ID=MMETSP0322-20121206/5552_1 /TAXON_ID=163516 /ORGANISM="Leptocylindrus danicus var. apora, Strain B651" /LENGTH=251 /DNA_ID=CAMNT_0003543331 /DNA_START=1 /DNA_END=756 /DNA_ORIENTATION=-